MTEQPDRDTHRMPRPVESLQQALQRGMLSERDQSAILLGAQFAMIESAPTEPSARPRAAGTRWSLKTALLRCRWGGGGGVAVQLAMVAWLLGILGWSWTSILLVPMTVLSVVMLTAAGLKCLLRYLRDRAEMGLFGRHLFRAPMAKDVLKGRGTTVPTEGTTTSGRRSKRGR